MADNSISEFCVRLSLPVCVSRQDLVSSSFAETAILSNIDRTGRRWVHGVNPIRVCVYPLKLDTSNTKCGAVNYVAVAIFILRRPYFYAYVVNNTCGYCSQNRVLIRADYLNGHYSIVSHSVITNCIASRLYFGYLTQGHIEMVQRVLREPIP